MTKVLEFPAKQSKKVRQAQRMQNQRIFLSMSLFSFILVAVFSSEYLLKNERPVYLISDNSSTDSLQQMNRAIASAKPILLFRDVEWEHQLAKKLAAEKPSERSPASIAQKVNLLDHLRFETLAGKYRIISSSDPLDSKTLKIKEIEYVDSLEVTDRPLHLPGPADEFLSRYADLLPAGFQRSVFAGQKDGKEVWNLVSSDQKIIGKAYIQYNDAKQFLGLKVQELPIDRVSDSQ